MPPTSTSAWSRVLTNVMILLHGLLAHLSRLDVLLTPQPLRLFEFCDLARFPHFLRAACQSMLTAQWTRRLPLLQRASPAAHAADVLAALLARLERADPTSPITVVDVCSGAGGPVPHIEALVNARRRAEGRSQVDFVLSDLHPHPAAWKEACRGRPHLRFVPDSVDATAVNEAAAVTARPGRLRTRTRTRTLRTFFLAFHHFDDAAAARVLQDAVRGADAVAVVELQDRRAGSVALMLLEGALVLLVTWAWFPWEWRRWACTYAVPVLPAVMVWDGVVSCLRTREAHEMRALDGEGAAAEAWAWEAGRRLHTWPLGHVNWFVGWRREDANAARASSDVGLEAFRARARRS